MSIEFDIEDLGSFRRLHTKGSHTHEAARDTAVCEECSIDLPFSEEFIRRLTEWDPGGVFHFIGERLCNDSFNEAPRRLVERFCPDLSGSTVLDFGSGLGQLGPFFFDKGARQVIYAEIDEKLLELSRVYLADHGYSDACEFLLVEEGDKLAEIADGSIDLVVASEVFEHILPQYREDTLSTLYKKLKPGGIILITSPNRLYPKDGHTTGLWFAAWLPARIGTWYARTFASWRWKGRSTEEMLRQGLRQYSYFEAKRVLKPLGAVDLCSKYPVSDRRLDTRKSVKSLVYYGTLNLTFNLFLRHLAPWEAWQASLELAWSKEA
jgi:2-polyprenyl-3-methyl-5-hydroxy-6-metoxy-1,4-benzoquinol methylase